MRPPDGDAGEPFDAGWVSQFSRALGWERDVWAVGGRGVAWRLALPNAVAVSHPPAGGGKSVRYRVRVVYTELPSGGLRRWWACPACGLRVGALYLPAGRGRMACRRCCGLGYRSQYTGKKRRRRKRRVVVTVTRPGREWTPATEWVTLSGRTTRR